MKKLFFFKSSSSSNGNNDMLPPKASRKQINWDNSLEGKSENSFQSPKSLFSKSRKQISTSQSFSSGPALRKSRSLSSTTFLGIEQGDVNASYQRSAGINDQRRSPPSISGERLSCSQRHYEQTQSEVSSFQHLRGSKRHESASCSKTHDLSGSSSSCSSNNSTKTIDRYIDEEQLPEKSKIGNSFQERYTGNGISGLRLPPKVHYTAPSSPNGSSKEARAHSFRETVGMQHCYLTRDLADNGYGDNSPRTLAKNVIERLSKCREIPRKGMEEFDCENPITIEDIYTKSLNGYFEPKSDDFAQKTWSYNVPNELTNQNHAADPLGLRNENTHNGAEFKPLSYIEAEDNTDAELRRRYKEAEERVMHLSEELEQESFLDGRFDIPALVQTTRKLAEERISLVLKVSELLHSRISDRASAKKELREMKEALDSWIHRMEKEKEEVQSGLEKELDRRSTDWSLKLEKYQLEERRLRERVRELAEQNVSLQRQVSSYNEKELENRNIISFLEQQIKELKTKMDKMRQDNQTAQQNLTEMLEKYKIAEENKNCFLKNLQEKDEECKQLHKSFARLIRTCSEQEKTIDGLREVFSEELLKNQTEKLDKKVIKMQMEQMRLTGVEMALRKELESCRVDVDSLRHENMNLLNRLKGNGREFVASTIKLEKELWNRISCLQNHALSMLNESAQLCTKLMGFIKDKSGHPHQNSREDTEVSNNGVDGEFLVECEVKIQGIKRGTEGLTGSLKTMSSVLLEKSSLAGTEIHSPAADANRLVKPDQTSEDMIRNDLKAESLMTTLLREKFYSKEVEVEQLQAELATAVRGNDCLRFEVQNLQDNLSYVTHKLDDFKLEVLSKDENINWLQSDLEKCTKELTNMRGLLPNVSEERDRMWEELKQCRQENMSLISEVSELKEKIEALDTDIHVKEGQITILRDTINKRPFDLLASPDSLDQFLLR